MYLFYKIKFFTEKLIFRIRHQLADPNSDHVRIVSGFLWVCLFVLLGKLASAAKEMSVAWRYGISHTVDSYVFDYNIINWPIGVWFSVLLVVLVPKLTRLKLESTAELQKFQAELFGLSVIGAVIWGIIAYISTPALQHFSI